MQISNNISLLPYNTFGIDVQAKKFASFDTLEELQELSAVLKQETSLPKVILGGGSNILFTKDVDGIVIKNQIGGIELIDEDEECYYVKAGAGVNWHSFVLDCIQHHRAGVENLSLIPGCVGASPMQNIGAYGVEIKDVFHSLSAYHMQDETPVEFSVKDCEFGYRESVFKNKYKNQFVITAVTYKLKKQPVYNTSYGAINQELERMGIKDISIEAISQAVINIRKSKLPDPKQIGNAGSFFKNPTVDKHVFDALKILHPEVVGYAVGDDKIKLAAGWLIEKSGWKGYREGDAGCHAKQALVLVNYGNASGDQIYALSEKIITDVQSKFGVTLEREVNIL